MGNRVCLLPQDPTTIFEKDTVMADLVQDISQKDESYLQNIINLCDLSELLYAGIIVDKKKDAFYQYKQKASSC